MLTETILHILASHQIRRSDLKWHRYEPSPEVNAIEDLPLIVEKDDIACFFG
jgi:hypothetical protein